MRLIHLFLILKHIGSVTGIDEVCMDARVEINEVITLGAAVCEKLKVIFHPDEPWSACHKQVAKRFSELKVKMREFYTDKDDKGILQELVRYSVDDLKDVLEI